MVWVFKKAESISKSTYGRKISWFQYEYGLLDVATRPGPLE